MNEEQLMRLFQQLKLEILDLLMNSDFTNDKEAQRTILTINNTFARLNQDVEEVLPPAVLQAYLEGLAEAEGEMLIYDIGNEELKLALDEGVSNANAIIAGTGEIPEEQMSMLQATLTNQLHYEAIVEINENLMMDLKASIRTAQQNTNISIENALADTQRNLQSGMIRGRARKVIQKAVMESFAENGFTAFITKDGRKLPLDFYSQVVTRTNIKRANVRGSANRYRQKNVQLFTVGGNYPTCSQCSKYRNFVFSMDPENDEFPFLSPETFPVHPNCQCSIRPFMRKFKSEEEMDDAKAKARAWNPQQEDYRTEREVEAYKRDQARNRKNNYEKKRYAEIKAIMGEEAPKTLGAFKRMKRANTDNYQALIYDYNETKKMLRERGVLT